MSFVAAARRVLGAQVRQQRGMATAFSENPLIPSAPTKSSVLAFLGIVVVVPTVVYTGASCARDLVAYVEDNDIWRPEEDDD